MIAQQVRRGGTCSARTRSHRNSLRAGIVVLGHHAIGHLIMRANEVVGLCAVDHRFDALPIEDCTQLQNWRRSGP